MIEPSKKELLDEKLDELRDEDRKEALGLFEEEGNQKMGTDTDLELLDMNTHLEKIATQLEIMNNNLKVLILDRK